MSTEETEKADQSPNPTPEVSDSENAVAGGNVVINEKSLLRKQDAYLLPAVG